MKVHRLFVVLASVLYCSFSSQAAETSRFAIAAQAVPVFNQREAARPNSNLSTDHCGQVRQLEFIALPGTVFELITTSQGDTSVVQVRTADYQPPDGTNLYVATASLSIQTVHPHERKPQIPSPAAILQTLRSAVGLPYVWGGNVRRGVRHAEKQQFAGLDCSGLLYEATNGSTPRNTAKLVQFGTPVPIEGKPAEQILTQLRPLDLLVWKGHVVIVLDQETAIESILQCSGRNSGVVLTPLKSRLRQIMQERRPVDAWPDEAKRAKLFVVRRWL